MSPNRRSAHVTLREMTSNRVIQAVSCHFEGFNLTAPTASSTSNGNNSLSEAIKLSEGCENLNNSKIDVVIMAGDFNAIYDPAYLRTPETYSLAQKRFEMLKDAGFRLIPNHNNTSYNKDLTKIAGFENGECILDYFFVKSVDACAIEIFSQFEYLLGNVLNNPSDHAPLFMNLHLK